MIKYFLVPLMFFLMTGCDCIDDGEINNLLTEFEKELIPFTAATSVNFINESSKIITGSYTAKENEVRDIDFSNDEECFATNIENEFSYLNIPDMSLIIQILVDKNRLNQTFFDLASIKNKNERYAIQECDGIVENLETKRKDIEVQGFMFTNVFVFKKCNEDGQIDQILYSPKNGVEFIDFADGSYLKLN